MQIAVPDAAIPPEAPAVETELAPPPPLRAASANLLDRRVAVRAALKAGVFGILASIVITPLLGTILAGALVVYFYHHEKRFALPTALAARLGGAAGIVVFAVNALTFTIWIFVYHGQKEYTEYLLKMVQRFGINPADPDIQASFHNLFTPSGLALTLFFGMIFTLALGSIGGALASLFMRPRGPRL